MAGVIDEFLLGIKMDGDPSKLVEAYKTIFALQDEYDQKQKEQNAAAKKIDAEEAQRDKKKEKTHLNFQKIQQNVNKGISTGVNVIKQGVSVARGWAVALLAVDGAAMSVIGKLSQMAVEYQNTATATGTSAAAMKAWEDTVKAAGGSAQDVDASMSAVYSHARNLQLHGGESSYSSAMGYFGVKDVDEKNNIRDTADIFGDLISSIQEKLKQGADPALLQQYMEDAGLSANLLAAIKAKQGGKYMVNQGQYQKYYSRAQGLDELANSSRAVSSSLTDLGAAIREKVMVILQKMVDSGVLQKTLDDLTKFVDGIDAEKVAKAVDSLIKALERVASWVTGVLGLPEQYKETQAKLEAKGEKSDFLSTMIDMYQNSEAGQQGKRIDALKSALSKKMGLGNFMGFDLASDAWKPAEEASSEGGRWITSNEKEQIYTAQAQKLGLNIGDIYSSAGINVTVNSTTMIDGKDIPSKTTVGPATKTVTTPASKITPGQKPASLQTWGGTK